MNDVFVGRLMSSPVHTVSPETTIQSAAAMMVENDISSVVVVDDRNRLRGILTSTDLLQIAAENRRSTDTMVESYMSLDVVTTTVNESIRDVADTIIENGFHHVPVVDAEDGVIGMITTTDFTSYLSHVQTPSPH